MLDGSNTQTSARTGERALWVPLINQALRQYESSLAESSVVQSLFGGLPPSSGFIDQASCSLLWTEAVQLADDPLFGMRIHRLFNPTSLNAIALTSQASPTLGSALNNLIRFFPIASTQIRLETRKGEDAMLLVLRAQGEPHQQHVEALIGYLCRLLHQLDQDNLGLLKGVALMRSDSNELEQCTRLLGCPVSESTQGCYLMLEETLLAKPLASADSFLLPRFVEAMEDLLANMPSNDLVEQVKRRIQMLLGSGDMSEERVAVPMNISPRHLRRKLNAEGTSYELLVDEVRKEGAIRMISQGQLSLTSIAYELGFLDPSSFTRAFRRWTGMSPTAFRSMQRGADASQSTGS
ncbi:AraC family transcriptional regulator ligand-binding domain-containing protein [uncultured Halopseudomonas sp.]|uniref:helix-turn-helix domain-containing protein n=1 Tax=uncultured Halopseudomonas sp. TaxID=2901193 RepID=UPI0030ED9427|tara:strand:- start:6027 stop:7079 length:1053 start_codon:yes stop_codon:yes gene_type:complete